MRGLWPLLGFAIVTSWIWGLGIIWLWPDTLPWIIGFVATVFAAGTVLALRDSYRHH